MTDPSPPKIVFVVAVAKNGAIGRDGALPWRLPGDLKRFRARTWGRPMLMGRKTFQSIGKLLPGRDTIVLTRDGAFAPDGAWMVHDVSAALRLMGERARALGVDEAIVVGGAAVYAAMLPHATEVHLTEVDLQPEADTFFPPLGAEWREASREAFPADEANEAGCVVRVLRRER